MSVLNKSEIFENGRKGEFKKLEPPKFLEIILTFSG